MKNKCILLCFAFVCAFAFAAELAAADRGIPASEQREIARVLTRMTAREVAGGWVRVKRMQTTRGRVRIYASIGLSYYPFRGASVRALYDSVRKCLPQEFRRAKLEIYTDGKLIEELIPLADRSVAVRRKIRRFTHPQEHPLVVPLTKPFRPEAGLQGRHIAVWQSHGRYFDQTENRWRWQRARLWQTCEDLFTQSFVLQYLVPMLENAGANVLLPRERDIQKNERIVDNDLPNADRHTRYSERSGRELWADGGTGFAYRKVLYRAGENPFVMGTVRKVRTIEQGTASEAVWSAEISETGVYAVYISYRTLPESADDALYTVRYAGGERRFEVNQTMGGGTWIYLGSFPFVAGEPAVVTLSNLSARAGRVVTADAVKIGGGFGNIVRTVCDSLRSEGSVYLEEPSGYPRYCEGARYWLQWAGFEEKIYSPKNHTDDYKDDYMSRALWVNTLMGGSRQLPDSVGLRIPVDVALAFHSDSGLREKDETVGTLGIFCTYDGGGRFPGGADRYLSRDLTDLVMTQVVQDIRRTFEPAWTRRGLWNRSYYEARVPCAPTMLLELLSHQNFADMRYGSDPRFRFVVGRAVYKGILRHLAAQYEQPCVVQPLPVAAFAARFTEDGSVTLAWDPVPDPLEPSARPDGYVVYTRIGDRGFDEGRFTKEPRLIVSQKSGTVYSYKVAAVNAGGESFPSEVLAVFKAPDERGRLLIVNAFDRVEGPPVLWNDSLAGFGRFPDGGVPYLYDLSYAGAQRVFDRAALRASDSCALGACSDDFETTIVGGNTFDYPYVHGCAAAAAGWSFASASARAAGRGIDALGAFDAVNVILGKQRSERADRGTHRSGFRTFQPALKEALTRYAGEGGSIFVSGCYVVSDLREGDGIAESDRTFVETVLHCAFDGIQIAPDGRVTAIPSQAGFGGRDYRFETRLCPERYAVESADVLRPMGEGAFAVMRYARDRRTAGVAWVGADGSRTVVLGFPFESLEEASRRRCLMEEVLRFFESGKRGELHSLSATHPDGANSVLHRARRKQRNGNEY